MQFRDLVLAPWRVANRSREIYWGLSRFGVVEPLLALGFEVGKRGLSRAGVHKAPSVPYDKIFGKRLVTAFVRLGPTFIKLGQLLATRPDFVGDAVAEELQTLYSKVPAIPFTQVKRIISRELGKTRAKQLELDPKPLGSGSLAQVHRGKLKDGTPVVVKVQKPGVEQTVRADLLLLSLWILPVSKLYPSLQLARVFDDFKDATLSEINYLREARNLDRFRGNFRKIFASSTVIFPKYFPDFTTERVLVMEPMHGVSVEKLKSNSPDAKQMAHAALTAVFEQIFDHGLFHADPHPGNLFFMEDEGKIGFIDLGMVGALQPEDRKKFARVLFGFIRRDSDELTRALYALGIPSVQTKYEDFEKKVHGLIERWKKENLSQLRFETLAQELFAVARKHGIHIPNRYSLMVRSFLMVEGLARQLDPKISVLDVAKPVVIKSALKALNPLRKLLK